MRDATAPTGFIGSSCLAGLVLIRQSKARPSSKRPKLGTSSVAIPFALVLALRLIQAIRNTYPAIDPIFSIRVDVEPMSLVLVDVSSANVRYGR